MTYFEHSDGWTRMPMDSESAADQAHCEHCGVLEARIAELESVVIVRRRDLLLKDTRNQLRYRTAVRRAAACGESASSTVFTNDAASQPSVDPSHH